jgi:hypothetical protein
MGPIKVEILLLAAALATVAFSLLDLIGIKVPKLKHTTTGTPTARSTRRYQLASAVLVVGICLYSMYSEATTGRSLSTIAACRIFSSGESCRRASETPDPPSDSATQQQPQIVPRTAEVTGDPPNTFCNQAIQPSGNDELDGMYMAAWNLDHGIGGRIDLQTARGLYRDAAERGHRASQYNFAVMLHRGRGGPVDNPSAVHWFRQAANQEDYLAILNLAAAYSDGWPGVGRDYSKALEYYLVAERCERGNVTNNIGVIYSLGGDGVERDLARAQTWFRKAEAKGSRHAAQNLATIRDGFDPGPERVWWDELGPT